MIAWAALALALLALLLWLVAGLLVRRVYRQAAPLLSMLGLGVPEEPAGLVAEAGPAGDTLSAGHVDEGPIYGLMLGPSAWRQCEQRAGHSGPHRAGAVVWTI